MSVATRADQISTFRPPPIRRWFIERENGDKIAGPFSTKDDAWLAREWVEKVLTPETFWIREAGSQ